MWWLLGVSFVAIIILIALCMYFFVVNKKQANMQSGSNYNIASKTKENLSIPEKTQEFNIKMELLPPESIDEKNLIQIDNDKIIESVCTIVPGLVKNGRKVISKKFQNSSSQLYHVVLPSKNSVLVKSKGLSNTYRGITKGVDGKINGQAKLIPAEKAVDASKLLASTMEVASMVVGQYYMEQINSQLTSISKGIDKIATFQDNEYRSKVFSLVSHTMKLAKFESEIIENNELRISKINQIDTLEEKCTQLLGQANLTISDYAKNTDIDFNEYEKNVNEAENWLMYQKSLLDVLYEIADLKYTLHLGKISRNQCNSLLPTYTKQVEEANSRLSSWNLKMIENKEIDVGNNLRKREGLDKMIHIIPGVLNNEKNYCPVDENTINLITSQSLNKDISKTINSSELYNKDVQIILKDDKMYYFP